MQLDAGQGSALSGVGLLWRQSGCASATKERKNNRGNGGEMHFAASAARFQTCNFCCCFSPPLRNGDRLPWTEQPRCPCNYSPPLLCVQVSADCLMDPASAICVLRAADLANGLIQHYAERLAALTCNAANGRGLERLRSRTRFAGKAVCFQRCTLLNLQYWISIYQMWNIYIIVICVAKSCHHNLHGEQTKPLLQGSLLAAV